MPENSESKPRRRFPVLFIVGLAVLVVLAAGGVFVWKYVVGGLEQTSEQTKTVTEEITRLEVDGDSGGIEVVEGSGDETIVETTLRWRGDVKPGHTQKVDKDTLRLKDSGCRRTFGVDGGCEVSWRVEVPADVDLDVSVDSGWIETSGIKGVQNLRSDSGVVDVTDPGAKLTIEVDSGSAEASAMPGTEVDAKVSSGNVDLGFSEAPDDVKVDNDSGPVTIRLPEGDEGYDVHTESNSGADDVGVQTDPDSDHKIIATTDSGRVSVEYA